MQFSVPQFIDVEDKVVGPFTIKQTAYLMAGGALMLMAYILFNVVFFTMVAAVVAPLTAGFVFWRPKGISMAKYLSNVIEFSTSEHLYVWRRDPAIVMFKAVQKRHTGNEEPMKMVSRSRIRDLANLLDTSAAVDTQFNSEARPDEGGLR